MGVQLNYIPMVTNSLKLNPFTHRAARHVDIQNSRPFVVKKFDFDTKRSGSVKKCNQIIS